MTLPSHNLALGEIFKSYQNFLKSTGYSKSTVKNYLSDLRHLVAWLNSTYAGDFHFSQLTENNLQHYRNYTKQEYRNRPSIISRRLSSLTTFLAWAKKEGIVPIEKIRSLSPILREPDDTGIIPHFRDYLKKGNYTNSTIKNYVVDLRHLISWVNTNYEKFKPSSINETSLRSYRSYLKEKFRSRPSISARRLSSLRKFLHWAQKLGLVTEDLLKTLQKVLEEPIEKPVSPVAIPLTPIQIVPPNPLPTPTPPVDISKYKVHQKIIHHIKHTRPGWYHRYHEKDWASTLHTVIMVVFAVLVGSLFLYTEVIQPILEQTQKQFAEGLGDVLAAATPPRVLSFQGRLTDDNDVPITSATNVVFKIYSVRTGGSPLWTSKTWSVTPDQNGIFSVCLGGQDTADDCLLNGVADTAIPADLFTDNAALYLGVTAGADAEMTPRQRIASVSYALNTDALEGFHGSQSPGANQVPILDGSGNLVFGGAATIDTSSGALTLGSAGTATIELPLSGNNAALTGNLDVSAHGAFGTSASVDSTRTLNVWDTTSGTTAWQNIYSTHSMTTTAATAANFTNINAYNQFYVTGGNATGILRGVHSTLYELEQVGQNWTFPDSRSFDAYLITSTFPPTTIDKYTGYYVSNPSLSSATTLTNFYGLYIEDITGGSGTVSNQYAIYQAGSNDLVTLNGDVSVGKFSGAGLTDCDSSVSILLWDSTNKTFSCGKDNDLVTLAWAETNLAASQTALQMDRPDSTGLNTTTSEAYMPYAGNIVGLEVGGGAARTAGTATFEVYKNGGATGLTVVIDGTNTQYNRTTQASGSDTFVAGDYIDVRETTDGTWAPTTAEWVATVWIEMDAGADLAELYNTADASIKPGDVVSLDPATTGGVKKSNQAYDKTILGVVSTNPGVLLGQKEIEDISSSRAVALSGRVPVKVSTENGPIAPGDLLTSSSTPGVAMKATRAGYVIGRALTPFNAEGLGSVIAFVNTHYANPTQLDNYGNLLSTPGVDINTPLSATSSALFSLDTENNLVASVSAGTKFVWENSAGQVVAWVSDAGSAFFQKITALVGDFGKLVFGELAVKKDAQTAGEFTFDPDQTEVLIKSDKVAENSLIYVTPTTKTDGLVIYVKEIEEGKSFTVGLDQSSELKKIIGQSKEATPSASLPIKFNWLIINQQ